MQYYDFDFKPTKQEEREIFGIYLGGNGDDNEGNVFVSEMNQTAPEGFDGNRHVFGNFFGANIDSWGRFQLGEKTLELRYKKEKAKIIEDARYKGLRQKEAILFQSLCRYLGEDYKGIFLYSASGPTSFNIHSESPDSRFGGKLGHWDYVDWGYCKIGEQSELKPGVEDTLRDMGIVNPFDIPTDGDHFWTRGANDTKQWKWATIGNKTTRIVPGVVGGKNWPELPIRYKSYDLAFAESDQTADRRLTLGELYKLAKVGGYIILPHRLLKFSSGFSDKVKLLLDSSEGDFSLLQKIS